MEVEYTKDNMRQYARFSDLPCGFPKEFYTDYAEVEWDNGALVLWAPSDSTMFERAVSSAEDLVALYQKREHVRNGLLAEEVICVIASYEGDGQLFEVKNKQAADILHGALNLQFPDWEDGEGASGSIEWNLLTNVMTIDHIANFEAEDPDAPDEFADIDDQAQYIPPTIQVPSTVKM